MPLPELGLESLDMNLRSWRGSNILFSCILDFFPNFSRSPLLAPARLPGLAAATAAAGTVGAGALRRLSGASSVGSPGPGSTAESGGTGPDGWDALALQYHVEWPLQLLLTPEVLAK